jgi:hypothetical protein
MGLGKHVYVEKPMTHNLYEARKLAEYAAANPKLMTQMGNQHHSENGLLTAVECVRSGMIGTVRQIHCFTNRPIWPQGTSAMSQRKDPAPPVPGTVEWDLWLGPAPARAYDPIYHPFKWRGWWDFGTGALGDMGCHIMDVPVLALGLERVAPRFVDPLIVRDATKETAPAASIIRYEFASIPEHEPLVRPPSTQPGAASAPAAPPAPAAESETSVGPQVTLFWYDGGELPLAFSAEIRKRLGYDKAPPATNPGERNHREENRSNGTIFVGDNGVLYVPVEGRPHFLDAERDRAFKAPDRTLPRPRSHHGEWIDAITGAMSRPPNSNFAYSGPLTELVLLGNLALRTGQRIEWDSKNLKVTNVPEANQYVRREYRTGWEV